MHVQFETSEETRIISYFASPQDAEVWPNIGEVQQDDVRWAAFYDAQPESALTMLPPPVR
ncbi:conserved hypothetical protein [Cupriavidus taiwanensis]|nr:conserved hypothetical protein [Cupriavidus taiwanensis]